MWLWFVMSNFQTQPISYVSKEALHWDICQRISWMGKSTLVQVMAWCRQATSHYRNLCWPRYLAPYVASRSQWDKAGNNDTEELLVEITLSICLYHELSCHLHTRIGVLLWLISVLYTEASCTLKSVSSHHWYHLCLHWTHRRLSLWQFSVYLCD